MSGQLSFAGHNGGGKSNGNENREILRPMGSVLVEHAAGLDESEKYEKISS